MRKILSVALGVALLASTWITPALAADSGKKEFKLDEAITMALKESGSYKKAQLEVEKNEEKRNNAADDVRGIPEVGGGAESNPRTEANWYSLMSTDLSWAMSKRSQTSEEDKLVLDICKKYWAVQQAEVKLKSKELAEISKETSLRKVKAMVLVGMTPSGASAVGPQMAIATAERELATAKMDLATAQNDLKSACENLNKKIGLQPDERPVLTDELKYEPIDSQVSVDTFVGRAVEGSPSLWLANESVTMADYAYELGYATGQYKDYDVRRIEKEQSQLDAVSAKDAMELLTRSLYYSVLSLEESIPASEKALNEAQEALRVAKLSYDLGMITRGELQDREAAVAAAQNSLLTAKANHAYYVLALQKPWAYSGS